MKLGILGTRHVHAEGLAACVELCGSTVVGATERDAEAAKEWTHSPLMSFDELLEASDAIIVAGTNRERVEDTLSVCRAGMSVLSEKPVSAGAEDLARLVAEADASLIMVALPVRFAASLQQARAAIQAGSIGTPLAARGTNQGQYPGTWFGDMAEAGGGAMQDHIVHLSDVLCWMLDDKITRSYARTSAVMHPDLGVETEGLVTLDFDSGFFASIDSSWSRPQTYPTWGNVWLEIVGTEGRLRINPMATHLDVFDDTVGKQRDMGYSDDNMTREMVRAFIEFATDGGTAPVTLAEGIHASDTVLASYASAASGRPEPVLAR